MSTKGALYTDPETKLTLTPHLKVIPYDKSRNEYMLVHTFYTKPMKESEINRMHYMIAKFVLCDAAVKCFNDYVKNLGEKLPISILTVYDAKDKKGVIREELKEYFTLISTDMYICYKREEKKQ